MRCNIGCYCFERTRRLQTLVVAGKHKSEYTNMSSITVCVCNGTAGGDVLCAVQMGRRWEVHTLKKEKGM